VTGSQQGIRNQSLAWAAGEYDAQLRLKATAGRELWVIFRDSSNSVTYGSVTATGTGNWELVNFNFTLPADIANGYFLARTVANVAQSFYVDAVQIAPSASYIAYIDGAQDNCRWAETQNIIDNPSFEVDLSGWTVIDYGTPSLTLIRDTTQMYAGVASAKVVNTEIAEFDNVIYNITGIETGVTYTLSAYCNCTVYTGGSYDDKALQLVANHPLETTAAATYIYAITSGWVRHSISLYVPPGCTSLDIRLYGPQGTIYWDALLLEIEPPSHLWGQSYRGGPYYNYLLPARKTRLTCTWDGDTYPIFQGYIESYEQQWKGGSSATCKIECADGFKILNLRHLNALASEYVQELSGARVNRVLQHAYWTAGLAWVMGNGQLGNSTTYPCVLGPIGDRVVDTGRSLIQAETLSNVSALSHLSRVVDAEEGALFVDRGGSVVFRGRTMRLYNRSSLIVFGDAIDEYAYSDVNMNYDDQRIYNEIRITPTGETMQTDTDIVSQDRFFPRTLALTIPLAGASAEALAIEASSKAHWLLRMYKDPQLRITSVNPIGRDSVEAWAAILGVELDSSIWIKRRPLWGDVIAQLSIVEGINHEGKSGEVWHTQWNLSPADMTSYWLLGDGTYSQLGSTTILAY